MDIVRASNSATHIAYSFEDLKAFLTNTQETYQSDVIDIIFFGGEPTLNYEFIRGFISYFGYHLDGNKINYLLHTNGILLDKADRDLLKNFKLLIVSINYEKIPKVGLQNSYFAKIMANVKHVRREYPSRIVARLTITENVSLYTNVMQVSSFFDYVHWQIQNCDHFNDYGLFADNYTYELGLLLEHWFMYFRRGFPINLVPFVGAVKLLLRERDGNILCGVNSRCVYVETDGKCYSCPESVNDPAFSIGDVFSGIRFKPLDHRIPKCKFCPYFTSCYGRCGRMHAVYDPAHVDEYCKLNENLFKFFRSNQDEIVEVLNRYPECYDALNDANYEYTEYVP